MLFKSFAKLKKLYFLSNISSTSFKSSYLLVFNQYNQTATASSSYSSNLLNFDLKKQFLIDKYATFTFENLISLSQILSNDILKRLNRTDLNGEKIAVYCSNNYTYLISILAVWQANGIPFCLSKLYTNNLIEYFLNDSKCKLIINGIESSFHIRTDLDRNLAKKSEIVNYKLVEKDFLHQINPTNPKDGNQKITTVKSLNIILNKANETDLLLLYTSGTTSAPKGCLITNNNLFSSIEMMIESYAVTSKDVYLSSLPLNHYSGLVYGLLTPFFAGAQVNLMAKFDAKQVWDCLLDLRNKINFFIAVPTIFAQLVNFYETNKDYQLVYNKQRVREILDKKMRIICSGSAPLNLKTFNDWYDLTQISLIERYGMTEIGMGLSNQYVEGTKHHKRIGGIVGRPTGPVVARIVEREENETNANNVLIESNAYNDKIYSNKLSDKNSNIFGELQIKGPTVFKEYFNKPKETSEAFTNDGWFKTGDTAEFLRDTKVFKIVGRTTVDVIKSGGYKISALDVEKVLLSHPLIDDVAVMGLNDNVWGQRVFALIVLKKKSSKESTTSDLLKTESDIKYWCKEKLPKYQIPSLIKFIDQMPRNQLGKVNKKELIKYYENVFESSK